MKKLLTKLVLMFFSCAAIYAQTDFRKGYIVKLNGDTLHGFVNFQKASQNLIVCNFKRFEIALPVNYSPSKLKAYGFDNGKQFVAIIYNGKPVFAEYLLRGKSSLLYLVPGRYFALTGNNCTELKSGKTLDLSADKEYSNYKEFLKSTFQKEDLNEVIDNSKMELNSLVTIFKLYNEILKSSYSIPERAKEKSFIGDYSLLGTNKIQFGVLGGVATMSYKVNSTDANYLYLNKADFSSNNSAVFGLFVKGNFSKMTPRLSYQADFLYQKVSLYGFTKILSGSYMETYEDIFIKFNALNTIFKLNYAIPVSRLKIIPHLGAAITYKFSSDYLRYREEYLKLSHIVRTYEYKNLSISKYDVGIDAGVSFEYRLSSSRFLQMNLEYIYGNKVIAKSKEEYSSASQTGYKGVGSNILLTLGITL